MRFIINEETFDISTGSYETEEALAQFVDLVGIDGAVTKEEWCITDRRYLFKVMTTGRNGPNDARPESEAFDDIGGFFEVDDVGMVTLTDKAKRCIRSRSTE